jgi:hypothetical protein
VSNAARVGYSLVDEIKTHTSIEDLFAREFPGVKLIRRGHRLWAWCPFHQERTPSFVIDTIKQRFHCFGCGTGGDVIDFYAKACKLDTREAIRRLAAELGLAGGLTSEERKAVKEARQKREEATKLNVKLELLVKNVRLECFDAERQIHQILQNISSEHDLDKPDVIWALENQSRVEYFANVFSSGTEAEQLQAALAFRGVRKCPDMLML